MEITAEQISLAIENFQKSGGLVQQLPPATVPGRMATNVDNPVQDCVITHCGLPEFEEDGETIDTIYRTAGNFGDMEKKNFNGFPTGLK